MHLRFLFHILGLLNLFFGMTLLLPLLVAVIYREEDAWAFFFSLVISLVIGGGLFLTMKSPKREIGHKEGFAIVGLGWLFVAFFGALPYFFSDTLSFFADAFFESMSGFTTTGATVLTEIEKASHSMLFWRCFTQWLGGMGIILLSIAILPFLGVGGMQLYKAEGGGPVTDKLKPRIGETAKILWKVYLLFTVIEIILLRAGGMSFYDAVCHSFSTMASGGFSTRNISVEAYHSAYIEGVICVFMFLTGVNFALHYKCLTGEYRAMLKDDEFKFYSSIVIISIAAIGISLIQAEGFGLAKAFRYSTFQVLTILTSTGFSSTNFERWPEFCRYYLFALMFIGGCIGSTSGGIKMLRIHLLFKQGYRELYRLIHPRAVVHVKFNSRKISGEIMDSIWGFFFLYLFIFVLASAMLTLLGMDMLSAATGVATCMGNIGPGLGSVGPYDNFSHLPALGKWVLSACMILGRLEIYTLLVLFIPEFWKK